MMHGQKNIKLYFILLGLRYLAISLTIVCYPVDFLSVTSPSP